MRSGLAESAFVFFGLLVLMEESRVPLGDLDVFCVADLALVSLSLDCGVVFDVVLRILVAELGEKFARVIDASCILHDF